jgi:hypothetical protein
MRTNARALSKIETDLEGEFKREAESPIKIGRLLIKAKELLDDHGEWLPWLGNHFPHVARTAQRYMSAAEFADKYDTVSHLQVTPGALYALAAADSEDNRALIEAALREAESKWIDQKRVVEILRAPPAVGEPPPDSGPPPTPPPAITPKKASLVLAFDNAVEAFKPLLAKRAADFVASGKPDHELREIANFLGQVIAGRQPAIDEPKQPAPPTLQTAPSPTITLGADGYTVDESKVAPEPVDEQSTPPVERPETAGGLDVTALLAGVLATTVTLTASGFTEPGKPETLAQKLARADKEEVADDLADRGQMSEKNNGEWDAGPGRSPAAAPTEPEDSPHVAAFEASGGTVTQCPPGKRRRAA